MPFDQPPHPGELADLFGDIDIYLFDQLLRGRINASMRILDARCGSGRNSRYLMRCGADVFGIDSDIDQIKQIRSLASEVAPNLPPTNFSVGSLTNLPFADRYFDAVVCNAVLHFAEDERAFESMMQEMWRVLSRNGVLFARLASSIGIETRVKQVRGRRHTLPDGTERFLVDESYLMHVSSTLGGHLLDPIKTTNVQNMRAMTTWTMNKL